SAADGESQKSCANRVRQFGEDFVATEGHIGIARVAADRAQAMKAGGSEGDDRIACPWSKRGRLLYGGKFIAGNLLEHEAVERLVGVEAIDHVVAKPPGPGSMAVVFKAF